AGDAVDGIQFTYLVKNGEDLREINGTRCGGTGGTRHTIELKKGEYLTNIEVQYGENNYYIGGLRLDTYNAQTGKRETYTYGRTGDKKSQLSVKNEVYAACLFGRSGSCVDAIGIQRSLQNQPQLLYLEQDKMVEFINISNQNLAGELNLSDFINLEKLNCSNNRLTSLNLSRQKKLKELNLRRNNFTSLDLKEIECQGEIKKELALYGNNLLVWQETHPELVKKVGKKPIINAYENAFLETFTTAPEYLEEELNKVQENITNYNLSNLGYDNFALQDYRPLRTDWEKDSRSYGQDYETDLTKLGRKALNKQGEEVKKQKQYYNNSIATLIAIDAEIGKVDKKNQFDGWKSLSSVLGSYGAQRDQAVNLGLIQALEAVKHRRQTVPIDGIYSILGLLPYSKEVEVSYSKSSEQALLDIMKVAKFNGFQKIEANSESLEVTARGIKLIGEKDNWDRYTRIIPNSDLIKSDKKFNIYIPYSYLPIKVEKNGDDTKKENSIFIDMEYPKGSGKCLGVFDHENKGKVRGGIIELELSQKELSGFLSLVGFTSLQKLNCSHNKITNFDLSSCDQILEFNCSSQINSQLEELDLSNCLELTKLNCSKNKLIELNLSNCSQLIEIDCYDNELFEAFNPKNLVSLSLSNNNLKEQSLTALDKFTNLEELYLGTDIKSNIKKGNYNHFVGSLEPLKNCVELRKLQIEGTDLEKGIDNLQGESLVKYLVKKIAKLEDRVQQTEETVSELKKQIKNGAEGGIEIERQTEERRTYREKISINVSSGSGLPTRQATKTFGKIGKGMDSVEEGCREAIGKFNLCNVAKVVKECLLSREKNNQGSYQTQIIASPLSSPKLKKSMSISQKLLMKMEIFDVLLEMDFGKLSANENERANILLKSHFHGELAKKYLKEYKEKTAKEFSNN
ncbi:15869_t:CDS:10, partial [Funneliformis geosporum]